MHLIWEELRVAVPMIWHGNPYLFSVIGFTLQVAAVATAIATVIGVPIGLAIALVDSPAGSSCACSPTSSLVLPPVFVGAVLLRC